ncbi:MAG: hypothetical protein MJ119_06025 [Lachnospiraceae bacterium]|nr:hypothetical protein [Lachnospiraceae bacterium]
MKKVIAQTLSIAVILGMFSGCNTNLPESTSVEPEIISSEVVSSETATETTEEASGEVVTDINAIVEDYDWEYNDWTFTEAKGTELKFDNAERFRHVQYFNGMTYINNRNFMSPSVTGFLMEGTQLDLHVDDYGDMVEWSIGEFWCYDNMIACAGGNLSLVNTTDFWGFQNLSHDCDQVFFQDGKLIAKISPEDNDDYIEIFDAYTGESLRKIDYPDFTDDVVRYLCEDYAIVQAYGVASWDYGIYHFDTQEFEKIDYYFRGDDADNISSIGYDAWVYNGNIYYIDNGNLVELYEQGERVSKLLVKDFDKICCFMWDMDENLILYENYDNDMVVYDLFTNEEKKICDKPAYVHVNERTPRNSFYFSEAWLSEGHVIVKEPREKKYDFDRNYLGVVYEYDLEGNKTFVTDKISANDDFF